MLLLIIPESLRRFSLEYVDGLKHYQLSGEALFKVGFVWESSLSLCRVPIQRWQSHFSLSNHFAYWISEQQLFYWHMFKYNLYIYILFWMSCGCVDRLIPNYSMKGIKCSCIYIYTYCFFNGSFNHSYHIHGSYGFCVTCWWPHVTLFWWLFSSKSQQKSSWHLLSAAFWKSSNYI